MNYSASNIFKRTILLARPYWGYIGLSLGLALLATPLALLRPLSLKILIDSGFGDHPVPGFIKAFYPSGFQFTFASVVVISISLIVIIAVIESIYGYINWVLNTFIGEKLVLEFRTLLFNHVQRLSLAYHDQKGTSQSSYRIQWDTVGIRVLILGNIIPLISSVISLVGMIMIMFNINWHFAVIALCVLPPLVVVTKISSRKMRRDWDKVKVEESSSVAVVNEVLNSVRIVKAFGQESNEAKRFEAQADKAVRSQIKIARMAGFFSGLTGLIFAVGTAAFLYFGARYVHSGQMTVGELTLVLAYLAQINGPLQSIIKITNDVQSSISSLTRVFTLLDMEKEVSEHPDSIHLSRVKGSCTFEDVSFGYKSDHPTLRNVSFGVQPGDRVGIIGTTGAGKSTLISLLTRFYDVTSGRILVDGEDIKHYKLEDYRSQFGIVLQEPVLFSTTISENIRYGKPDATEQEIIEAAKAANAHDFIIRCKDGYDTVVGERGALLSGGERQRISIARAFIKDAPMLILDEPTSSVDMKTEGQIMEAMERLMKGRTTFMITHRIDTLKACNIILELGHGRLIDIIRHVDESVLEQKKKSHIGIS